MFTELRINTDIPFIWITDTLLPCVIMHADGHTEDSNTTRSTRWFKYDRDKL